MSSALEIAAKYTRLVIRELTLDTLKLLLKVTNVQFDETSNDHEMLVNLAQEANLCAAF